MNSDQRRLRVAFSDPHADMLRITAEGSGGGWLSPEAVTDDMPVSCLPKDGLLVLDLDKPRYLRLARRLERSAPRPLLIVKWASGGITQSPKGKPYRHQQWVLVVPEGTTTEALRESCLAAGLPKSAIRYQQRSRPPLAAHRKGNPTELLHPHDVDAAVAWMTGPRGRSIISGTTPDDQPLEPVKPRRDLSPKVWRLAEQGKAAGNYETGPRARYALARYLAEAGWDFQEFLAFILSPEYRIGDSEVGRERDPNTGRVFSTRRSDKAVADRMVGMWNSAVRESSGGLKRRANSDSQEHAFQVAEWRDRALAYLYADERTKDSDRQVIEALAILAIRNQSWTVMPGSRGLADEANLTHNTAQNALHRFKDARAMSIQAAPDEFRTVQSDRLHINKDWLTGMADLPGGDPAAGWFPDLQDPQVWLPVHSHIWDGQGLGTAALRVYCELTHGWMNVTDLRNKTQISEKAIERALRLLMEVGRELDGPLIRSHSLSDKHRTWQAVALHDPKGTEKAILNRVRFQGGTITDHIAQRVERHRAVREGTLGARQWEAQRRQALAT